MTTLYERIGGQEGIAGLVDAFYERVLADPELGPFFASTSIDRLRRMQLEFFTAATGGPLQYSGLSIRDAHSGRGIGSRQLTRFVDHLVATLHAAGLGRDEIDDIARRIGLSADDVLGGATDAE